MNISKNISALFFILMPFVFLFSCTGNDNKPAQAYTGMAEISFQDSIFHLGDLYEGEITEHTFTFSNTGTAPLKITNIETDCGCTAAKYEKRTILPGEKSKIKVRFDSKGFRNNIYKTISVETNTNTKKTLILTAFIKNNNTLN